MCIQHAIAIQWAPFQGAAIRQVANAYARMAYRGLLVIVVRKDINRVAHHSIRAFVSVFPYVPAFRVPC